MERSKILDLINKSEALTLEVFRRANVTHQVHRPTSFIMPPSTPPTTSKHQNPIQEEDSIESIVPVNDFKKNRLFSKSSTESKKKHLTFSKDEVGQSKT